MIDAKPILLFQGRASEVIEQYQRWFSKDFTVLNVAYIDKTDLISMAELQLFSHRFLMHDQPLEKSATFSPTFSFIIECNSIEEIERFSNEVSVGGLVMLPLDNYGFSEKFIWLQDRFGISWQFTYRPKFI